MNLNQVTLPVNDMEMSTKFYRDLGFTQIVDTPTRITPASKTLIDHIYTSFKHNITEICTPI